MRLGIVGISLALLSTPVFAQDRLEPERGILGGDPFFAQHEFQVVSVLPDAFDNDVTVRMIVLPSFTPEYAVGIRFRSGKFQIFSLEPAEQIMNYDLRNPIQPGQVTINKNGTLNTSKSKIIFPPDVRQIPLKKCEVPIDAAFAMRIVSVWKEMLLRVQNTNRMRMMPDGVEFHFSMFDLSLRPVGETDPASMSGMIVSPDKGSNDAAMAEIGETMKEICVSHNSDLFPRLDQEARVLKAKLH